MSTDVETKTISWIHVGNTMEKFTTHEFRLGKYNENTCTEDKKTENCWLSGFLTFKQHSNVLQIPCKIRLPLFRLWKHRVKWHLSTYVAYHRNVSVLCLQWDLQLYPPNPYQVNHNFVSAQNGRDCFHPFWCPMPHNNASCQNASFATAKRTFFTCLIINPYHLSENLGPHPYIYIYATMYIHTIWLNTDCNLGYRRF